MAEGVDEGIQLIVSQSRPIDFPQAETDFVTNQRGGDQLQITRVGQRSQPVAYAVM